MSGAERRQEETVRCKRPTEFSSCDYRPSGHDVDLPNTHSLSVMVVVMMMMMVMMTFRSL